MEGQRRNTTSSSAKRRKPLSDCSNTLPPLRSAASCSSSSSSSSLLKKPLKPLPSSSQLLHSRHHVNPAETHLDKAQSTIGSTTAAVMGSSTSTPARPQRKPSSAAGGDDVWEPSPVYVRRQSGSKRKDKETTVEAPSTKRHSSWEQTNEDGGTRQSKSLIVPRKKKTLQVMQVRGDIEHKEFIEQQKAYFAEIDAFELPEEEVTSADELE